MDFIGKNIEKKESPASQMCENQLEEILEIFLSGKRFSFEQGVREQSIHENGLKINFILEPAREGADRYNYNIPCTLFIYHPNEQTNQSWQVCVIQNDEEEKCKEIQTLIGQKIEPTKQLPIIHKKIENKKYLEKYKEIIPIINEILKKKKELGSKKNINININKRKKRSE